MSARSLALWAAFWLSLVPALAGAVPLPSAPRGAGALAVRDPTSGVVELVPVAGGYEGSVLVENRGKAEFDLKAHARTAAREPLAPAGLSLTFTPGGASTRVPPGQTRRLNLRWVPPPNGLTELDGAVVVEAVGVDSAAVALRAEAPRGRFDARGLLGRHLLSLLTLLPFVGMAAVGLYRSFDRSNDRAPRLIALSTLLLEAALVAWLLAHADRAFHVNNGNDGYQFRERWALWGGGLELFWALDGASYGPLVSAFVVCAAGLAALRAVELRVSSAYAGLLGALGGAVGVACAADLVLATVCWLALVASVALLVGPEGGGRRLLAAGGVGALLLAAGAASLSGRAGPTLLSDGSLAPRSFALPALGLLGPAGPQPIDPPWALAAWAAALAPAAAFAPFQGWLLRAIGAAPAGAAAVAAGVLPATSLYALLRLSAPFAGSLGPRAAGALAAAGAVSTLVAFVLVFYETDLRRASARLALAPLPLALLGLAGQTSQGAAGAFALAAGQGLVAAALVLVAGVLAERIGHARRDLLVGVGEHMPRFALLAGLLALASFGGPGAWSFWAALLVFWGAWPLAPLWVCVGALALGLGAAAAWLLARNLLLGRAPRRLAHDPRLEPYGGRPPDLSRREWALCAPLVALVVALGCFPRPLLGPIEGAAADVPLPPPTREEGAKPPAERARPFRPPPPPAKVPLP
ncbi:MAG TPA: proton-conducting transporter membrane subunit [Polyangiaceae bacterium]|nr:proton-conducting transporter membrane subunit [Polyangiaceae bacterium]